MRLARAKAGAAATPGCFVLAADTVVACGRRILPKAGDRGRGARLPALLSGRRHRVLTAVVLVRARRPPRRAPGAKASSASRA